ncbi:MAG: site-2 protease family protein [Candidatus Gracilibacteria bacterium]|nr:site-2 protease family protein [Candidatus Gracilibacteria bacterium]
MLNIILGIILALIVFFIIVLFHEFGHFIFARIFGVKVDEFGIGIPPKIKDIYTDKKGTVYTLNALPIGGFVKLKGENFDAGEAEGKDSLVNKPVWQQIIVVLAGIFMNLVLAFLIFAFLFNVGVKPIALNEKFETRTETKLIPSRAQAIKSGLLVQKINFLPLEGTPASNAGIKDLDVLISINGKTFSKVEDVKKFIGESKEVLNMKISREGKEISLSVAPKDGKIGTYILPDYIDPNFTYKYGFFESIKEGAIETKNQFFLGYEILGWLGKKIFAPTNDKERTEAVENLGGPIAIGDLFVKMVENNVGYAFILIIGALISINLGFFNLIPFPALDGGRAFLLIINKIGTFLFGKKFVGGKMENLVHIVGFSCLIILSLLIAFKDVLKIVHN